MPRYDVIFVVSAPTDDDAATYQEELLRVSKALDHRTGVVLLDTDIKQSEEQEPPLV